ncbi:hypothetical protein GCM10023231_24240 [Olivibacter ginsenosidimutans]|uniref:SDR family oxidoreductase n=1 Tax=Olivibacter ginsenosidimutans TaxID=1176537 RepID=A0ABP9BGC4_9SPHI
MNNLVKDKVVVITGGNSGIGYATAKAFSNLNANVLITGKREEALKKVSEDTGIKSILANQSVMADIDNLATAMQSKFGIDEATLEVIKRQMIGQVPLGKMGTPEDVAKLVVYLSDNNSSSFITGAEFFIDGGMAL